MRARASVARFATATALAFFLVTTATSARPAPAPADPMPSPTLDTIRAATAGVCAACRTLAIERRILVDDIAHVQVTLHIGPGEHDRIRLHRVVREASPGHAAYARHAAMLVHGTATPFVGTFLANSLGPDLDPDHSLAVHLARAGVDVWGVDLRWTLVPAATDDLTFMAEWGLERDASDLETALHAARGIRLLTGQSRRRLDLVGYSRGMAVGFALLNHETRKPRRRRQVDSFVAIDGRFVLDDADAQAQACIRRDAVRALIEAGNVAIDNRGIAAVGQLALTAPDDPSPFFPGLTHRQAALVFASLPPGGNGTFHAFSASFVNGLPDALLYSAEGAAFHLFAQAAPYQPRAAAVDILSVQCGDATTAFDDRLDEITVPVLAVAAAGGNGGLALGTLDALGSREIEVLFVSVLAPGQELFDIAHGDLLTMADGASLVWQPVLERIIAP